MSKLIVAVFNDAHRALQVISEIRRTPKTGSDFDNALVLTWSNGNLIVQPSLKLADRKTVAWARLWGAFLFETTMQNAVAEIEEVSRNLTETAFQRERENGDRKQFAPDWWRNNLNIPGDFLRDVGALIEPGNSAFFCISRNISADAAAEITRSFGGTFLTTHLAKNQMAKIRAKVKQNGY